jgi:ABC-type glutathione transport system ATPase component
MLADEPTGELDSATATAIFNLLRDIARGEGITIITSTHDRLVMEMADRIEELVDGHKASEGGADVWRHVQAKERSPFAAPVPEAVAASNHHDGDAEAALVAERRRLSSLVGADTSQFGPLPPQEPVEPTPDATVEPPAASDEDDADDVMRWAPPERR